MVPYYGLRKVTDTMLCKIASTLTRYSKLENAVKILINRGGMLKVMFGMHESSCNCYAPI